MTTDDRFWSTQAALAGEFGVSQTLISKLVKAGW